jgi:hypothetical protein
MVSPTLLCEGSEVSRSRQDNGAGDGAITESGAVDVVGVAP